MDPTPNTSSSSKDDDDITVVTSNTSYNQTAFKRAWPLIAMAARTLLGNPMPQYLNAITIATNQAIANTGATSILIMAGMDVDNKHLAVKPLTINLPD